MRVLKWTFRSLLWTRSQLTAKGVLTVGLWSVALISVVMAFAVRDANRSVERQAEATASRLAAAVEQDIARNVELLDLGLRAVTATLQSSAVANPAVLDRFPHDRYVSFIEVVNEKGDVTAASPPARYGENWASRDYFREAIKGPLDVAFIGQAFGSNGDNTAISVSRRIDNADGTFAGVVVIGLKLDYFHDLLKGLGLGPHVVATVVQPDGIILARLPYDRSEVGRVIDVSEPYRTFVRSGETTITTVDPTDHLQRHFVYRRVGNLPLVVSIGIATGEFYADGLPSLWLILLSFGTLSLLIASLSVILSLERRKREAAELKSSEKTHFLTMLSHELRTPLHGVLGYTEQLSNEAKLAPEPTRQVAEITRCCRHMRDVVDMVLDYARIEALGPTIHMHRIDVRTLIDECMAVIELGAKARGLETRVIAASTFGQFVTDDVQLRLILLNLLSNAVKYTPRGMIELRLAGDESLLMIEVADTGIGIPETQRHLLFKEYERFGTERTSIEGTGLGLSIAHRLARRMGGHMGHRNNPGGGSVFWLELPAGVADAANASGNVADVAPDRNLIVLVVDDSEVNRSVAAAYLRKAGCTAIEAHDGVEAVRLVAAMDFDVVLMDMRMAGMDGLEATRLIRALDGPRAQVPIIAVTANALDQHAEECRRAGMSQHLAKPFTQADLIAVIKRSTAHRADASCDALQTIDRDSIAELASYMDPDAIHRLLDCLSLRIEALLRKLDEPMPFGAPEALAEQAHELAGGAGTLGFLRLSRIAARFQTAIASNATDAERMVAEMRREAEAALVELRHQRALESLIPA
jgi:signal transduction histidine kinase/DNA-binding NarL/FixJ family response regulator